MPLRQLLDLPINNPTCRGEVFTDVWYNFFIPIEDQTNSIISMNADKYNEVFQLLSSNSIRFINYKVVDKSHPVSYYLGTRNRFYQSWDPYGDQVLTLHISGNCIADYSLERCKASEYYYVEGRCVIADIPPTKRYVRYAYLIGRRIMKYQSIYHGCSD